jgi:hypothetical protein
VDAGVPIESSWNVYHNSNKDCHMKKFYLALVLATPIFANSADLKSKDDVVSFVKTTQSLIAAGDVIKAIEGLKPYVIIPESEFQVALEQYKMQKPMIDQRFGKTIGTELISVQEQGESLMLATFIQKFEKHVMRWRLYFYKPRDKWILNTYFTDDKINEILTK